ncbi:uncharacterized protein LOC125295343 isoform X2 [Alosa alosa]|uniref:uncharacterized protein LOC125295343 isoform X2 n=1 Tax=Alosa alosa TaxID=278164 RepID=UPI002015445F|nr:uncharacterized protein LOC125295343 isoform X2 [Alosa alosa]
MLKRATSPEPFRSEKRLKQERPDSPAPSCLNVLKQERSDSSTPSCTSKDLPDQFKLALRLLDSSELTTSLLTKGHFTCSVCTEVLKDPVSIPCGHSYCRQCITSYWAQPNHAGHYACAQCSQTYSSCPALYTNSALAVVVQKLQHFSPVSPDHCYAGLGDVACDFCTGRKLRAVKSCLTCSASYCESHIRQHYTVAALQKHTLVEPQIQEQKLSQQHDIKIEDFKCIEGEDLEWLSYGLWSPDADQSIQQGTLDQRVKLEKSDSPAPSCVTLKSMDPPDDFQRESKPDSIVKLERSDSPAPSCVSLKSMDPPDEFKKRGTFTPYDSRVKLERSDSPAPSCVSLKSMDPPEDFRGEFTPRDSRLKLEGSDSPAASCLSLDQPDHFKDTFTSDFIANLLTKDHFRCSVCTEVLKDPVSIPCGHSYCRLCITSYWAQHNHAGLYACPQCSRTYSSCPALYTNSALAVVVQKLQHFSPVSPDHCYAGLGDVACDFCTGRKLRAVKSCLTCSASYCEIHVTEHYTIPVLQTHILTECTHQNPPDIKQTPPDIKYYIKTEELNQVSFVCVLWKYCYQFKEILVPL